MDDKRLKTMWTTRPEKLCEIHILLFSNQVKTIKNLVDNGLESSISSFVRRTVDDRLKFLEDVKND
jgi:hypothetical protein